MVWDLMGRGTAERYLRVTRGGAGRAGWGSYGQGHVGQDPVEQDLIARPPEGPSTIQVPEG